MSTPPPFLQAQCFARASNFKIKMSLYSLTRRWNGAPPVRPHLHAKVSAFVETVRASRLYGAQAWFSARADERRLNWMWIELKIESFFAYRFCLLFNSNFSSWLLGKYFPGVLFDAGPLGKWVWPSSLSLNDSPLGGSPTVPPPLSWQRLILIPPGQSV